MTISIVLVTCCCELVLFATCIQTMDYKLLGYHLHLCYRGSIVQSLGIFTHVEPIDFIVDLEELLLGPFGLRRHAAAAFEVDLQAALVDVAPGTEVTLVRPLLTVQAPVQLEVDKLGEFSRAVLAVIGPLSRVKAEVSLQVAGAAETFVANLALVWLFSSMYKVMLLQVGQLCEGFTASVAGERSFSTVDPQMHF